MAKVKLNGVNYHMQAPEEVCHYNSGVLCGLWASPTGLWASPTGKDHCTKCGWNPAVFQIRKERLNDGQETAAEAEGG